STSEEPSINKTHIELLRSLTPADSALLDLLHPSVVNRYFASEQEQKEFSKELNARADTGWQRFSENERDVSVQNLIRLRCITAMPRPLMAENVLTPLRNRDLFGSSSGALVDPLGFEKVLIK